ncbi:MAG TPA: cysteine synthase family protein [Thermoplasmata archaeon]|nr:cysteine synthase family protein [Thermoplasmata archaeon]
MYASDPAALIPSVPATFPERRGRSSDDPFVRSIGTTPLVPLHRVAPPSTAGFELWGKAEFRNPTGSVKDRAALGIVRAALAEGHLGPGRVLVDASSGNTALAYAMLGARLGFPVEVFLPRNVAPDRLRRLRAYGTRVVFTDPAEGTDGAQVAAREKAESDPDRYFYADQYNNPANPAAHYASTGPELWRQTQGRISHLVAGVGTGGTISGTGRYLKEREPSIRVVGVEPSGPIHGLEGLKHLPSAIRPTTYDAGVLDESVRVETEEAVAMAERLGSEEGLVVGPSSGAAAVAALRVGADRPGSFVVVILPDAGRGGDSEAA